MYVVLFYWSQPHLCVYVCVGGEDEWEQGDVLRLIIHCVAVVTLFTLQCAALETLGQHPTGSVCVF